MTNTFDYRKTQFALECKAINLSYEYDGYTGEERYAIITALSETEMLDKYADILDYYAPYVLLTEEQGAAIIEHQNNEAKHRMRNLRSGHAFDINDGEFEEHHPEFAVCEDIIEKIELQNQIRQLREAIATLPEVQKRRLVKYFFEGRTYKQIGAEEGVDYTSVRESIAVAIKKLKKFF